MEFLKSVCFAKNFFNLAQVTVKRREVERWQNKRNFWLFFANRWIISIIYLKMEETGDKWNGGEPFHYNLSMNKFEYKKNRDTDSSVSFGRLLFSIFHFFFFFFFLSNIIPIFKFTFEWSSLNFKFIYIQTFCPILF